MKLKIYLSAVTILFFTAAAFPQISIKLGAGGGVVTPAGDYGGSTVDFYNGTKYGLSTGYNLHVKAKVALLSFAFKGEIDYSSFSNDGTAFDDGRGTVEVSQSILAVRVGPEFRFDIPLMPITPYIDVNLAMNSISGEVIYNGVAEVPSGTYDVESATRFGIGLGGGVEFSLGPVMTLDLGIHYNMVNLLGKEYKSITTNPNRIDGYTSVNDDKDPLYADNDNVHFISDSRSINNIQFTLTLLFGI
jgi:opacity protein-like surface antigen